MSYIRLDGAHKQARIPILSKHPPNRPRFYGIPSLGARAVRLDVAGVARIQACVQVALSDDGFLGVLGGGCDGLCFAVLV